MGLKIVEDNLDGVEEHFHSLYTEKDGKFHLTGIDGMKTDADINRLSTALTKERNDHKAVKEKYAPLAAFEPSEILEKLDRIPELEAAAAGKLDDTQINAIVETRVKAKIAPLERDLKAAQDKALGLESMVTAFSQKEKTSKIHKEVREAAIKAGVRPDAIDVVITLAEPLFDLDEDGQILSKENSGITQGIAPTVWLSDLQSSKAFLWGESSGGGATGGANVGGANNPWSAKHWNKTEQGKIYAANKQKAEQYAKAAGVDVFANKPVQK